METTLTTHKKLITLAVISFVAMITAFFFKIQFLASPALVAFFMCILFWVCELRTDQLWKGFLLILIGAFFSELLEALPHLVPATFFDFKRVSDLLASVAPVMFYGAGGSVIGTYALRTTKEEIDKENSQKSVVLFDKNYRIQQLEEKVGSFQTKLNILIGAIVLQFLLVAALLYFR
ncbi:hypothetical protein PTW35_06760 [Photobacterium sp. DA100]|uniref:hypothetical protein n=1 Tax=Photobacterium sp. DA100 TaxID=3027472 RepID=UPI00247A5532|nr:hypothetical protein [Photobacterium sp. DA100]WEM43486.1 hypothetical protein PTW35_06760 [Photobacterium sp. DA100]